VADWPRCAVILLLCVFLGVAVRHPGHYGHCERDRMSRTWLGRREKGSGRGVAPDSADSGPASPVTEAARAAAAGAWVPGEVPPGATPLLTIDALGRKCPIPIIMLAAQIRDVPVGEVIAVLADDPAVYTDVPAWCALKSHECVFRADLPSGWAFGIRRGY